MKEILIGSVLTHASKLASMDKVATSEVLHALAHMVEKQVAKEHDLCTHGRRMNIKCEELHGFNCKLKSCLCEKVEVIE